MDKKSKPIGKGDDDAKLLIIEALEGNQTGGFDIDSIYKINDKYYILEFLKCDTVRPNDSHPNRYWYKNKQKFISLWSIARKLDGFLFLVNYENSRKQFKVIKVLDLDNSKGIIDEEVRIWNFNEFKKWFKSLNNKAIQS